MQLSEVLYNFTMIAGAGKCDLSKGTEVGYLTVRTASTSLVISYVVNNNIDGAWGSLHLWVGCARLPVVTKGKKEVETKAPGQFPYKIESVNNSVGTFQVPLSAIAGCENNFWIAAHAEFGENSCRKK